MPNWKDLKARKRDHAFIEWEKKRRRNENIRETAIDHSDKAEQNLYKKCSRQSPGENYWYEVRDLLGLSKFKLELGYEPHEITDLYEKIAEELETRLSNHDISVQRCRYRLGVCLP